MEHAPAKLLLIGAGRMGRFHLHVIRQSLPDIDVIGIVDPSAKALEHAIELAPEAQAFGDAAQALGLSDAHGCLIAGPSHKHPELVARALDAGLHVLCEKPLTLEPGRSEDLGARAQALGLVLQVGFWRRFAPALLEAKRLLLGAAIGRPVLVRLVQWDADCPPARWCEPEKSGGIFVDMGVHEFDQLEWLLGKRIVELHARTLRRSEPELEAVDDYDNAVIWARVNGDVGAAIELSRTARYADDVRLEILGDDGALFADMHPSAQVRVGSRSGLVTVWTSEEDQMAAGVAAELAAFTLAIEKGGGIDWPGAGASIRATRLAQLARESAARGEPVGVDPAG
jgi:myo-inositol 2-dehydrogenase/D-chiro-inositol 1-dehydrogenase